MLRSLICTALLTALLLPIITRAEAPTSAPVNTAVVPKSRANILTKHAKNVERAKQGDIDLLFLGDSITDHWTDDPKPRPTQGPAATQPWAPGATAGKPVWDQYFAGMKAANFGISHDRTEGILWRLQNGEGTGFSPKAVMLMIGTNNTNYNTAEETIEGIKADVAEIRKDFPQAKILLLAIFPRNGPDRCVDEIKIINPAIAKLDDGQHVFFLDIGKNFLGPDGKVPQDVMADGLHPTTKGYEIWAKAVIEPLKKLMQ